MHKPLCPLCGKELQIRGGPEDWKPTFYDPDSGGDPYHANCECGFFFSSGTYEYENFITALNRRALPENEPLTLEELRQMDGEPVWTTGIGANRNKCYWCLVMVERESVFTVVSDEMVQAGVFYQYGKTWLAYRRKPKEE